LKSKSFAARVWSKLIAFQKAKNLLEPGDRVLAAVSGGPDSVCLVHYLAQMSRRIPISVAVAHVHHGLRGRPADIDADFVRKLSSQLGLATALLKVPVARTARKRGMGVEEAARKLRYAALVDEARRLGFNKIATGHHMDDQAETVLLNLLRGTQLAALAAMPAQRPISPKIGLIRPLLALKRSEIMLYLKAHRLKYRLDRSNLSTKLTRNWLRREALPFLEIRNPRVREHLAGIAEQVQALPLSLLGRGNTGA
jgi:tRNA(Ile)-lysidine synthase